MKKLAVLAFVLAATAAPAVAQTRGVTADDYLSFESLSDPHFSPDGSTIAYVVTTIDRKQNRRHSDIWSVPADGLRDPVALTASPHKVDELVEKAIERIQLPPNVSLNKKLGLNGT